MRTTKVFMFGPTSGPTWDIVIFIGWPHDTIPMVRDKEQTWH